MSERNESSPITESVLEEKYRELISDTKAFIRSSAALMELRNALALDGILEVAAGISLIDNPESARQVLAGHLFFYECAHKGSSASGSDIPRIEGTSLKAAGQEITNLAQSTIQTGKQISLLQEMVSGLEIYNPDVGSFANKLLKGDRDINARYKDAFIQGMHNMQVIFKHAGSNQQSENMYDATQIEKESVIPRVSRSTARSAVLNVLLDRDEFVSKTLSDLDIVSSDLASKIREVRQTNLPTPDIYELAACLELNCLLETFRERNVAFPEMNRRQIETAARPSKLTKAMRRGDPNAGRLLIEFQATILTEIENSNPDLFWALRPLLRASTQMREPMPAVINGIVQPYNAVKARLSLN